MRVNGLLGSTAGQARVVDLLRNGHRARSLPSVVLARTTDRVGAAIDLLQLYGISQLPVSEAPEGDLIDSIVGSVCEQGLLQRTYRDPSVVQRTIGEVMDRPLPTVEGPASLDSAFSCFQEARRPWLSSTTAVRQASSPSSTCWSTWRTVVRDALKRALEDAPRLLESFSRISPSAARRLFD